MYLAEKRVDIIIRGTRGGGSNDYMVYIENILLKIFTNSLEINFVKPSHIVKFVLFIIPEGTARQQIENRIFTKEILGDIR